MLINARIFYNYNSMYIYKKNYTFFLDYLQNIKKINKI